MLIVTRLRQLVLSILCGVDPGRNRDSATSYLNRGNTAFYEQSDVDSAIKYYSNAIRLDPTLAVAYDNRGAAWAIKGEPDTAIKDFTEAIRIDPGFTSAYFNRAKAWRDKGDLDAAIKDCSEVIRLNPKSVQGYSGRGTVCAEKGDLDAAIKDFTEAIQLAPQSAATYRNRAITWRDKGDLDAAIDDLSKVIRLDPRSWEAYYDRGTACAHQGDLDAAINDLSEVIRLNPMSWDAYYHRGTACAKKGDLDAAIRDFTEAIKRDPEPARAYFSRATAWRAKGDLGAAINDWSEVIRLNPKSVQAYNDRGTVCAEKGDLDAAAKDFNEAIQLALQVIQIWPDSLVADAEANGLHMNREEVANLPTLEDLFALVRIEAGCRNPYKMLGLLHLKRPKEGPGGGYESRQWWVEQIAAGRSYVSKESPEPGPHPVIVITPGRHLIFFPTSEHRPSNETPAVLTGDVSNLMDLDSSGEGSSKWTALLQPRGVSSCNIAVIACTWGLLQGYKNKNPFELTKELIPFFDSLLDLAFFGHNVWVFDGHPLTLPAGCRNADAVLVDPNAAAHLPHGWTNVVQQVMRGRERLCRHGHLAQMPIWSYDEATRSFGGSYNMTPGHGCDGFEGSVAEWLAAYRRPASTGDGNESS